MAKRPWQAPVWSSSFQRASMASWPRDVPADSPAVIASAFQRAADLARGVVFLYMQHPQHQRILRNDHADHTINKRTVLEAT